MIKLVLNAPLTTNKIENIIKTFKLHNYLLSQMTTVMTDRKQENGPLEFHKGVEELLVDYVINNAKQGDVQSAVDTIDEFCWKTHWMMNLGDEKGKIYTDKLKDRGCLNVLELGMYVGYSALRALAAMGSKGVITCVDPNKSTNALAKKLYDYAGCSNRVTVLEGKLSDFVDSDLKGKQFDCVFLDHDKKAYFPDMLLVEKHDLLMSGGMAFADNVVIFGIDDYMNHVNKSSLYTGQFVKLTKLEYSTDKDQLNDGVHVAFRV